VSAKTNVVWNFQKPDCFDLKLLKLLQLVLVWNFFKLFGLFGQRINAIGRSGLEWYTWLRKRHQSWFGSIPGQAIPKTWKHWLADCPASCSGLIGGCKERIDAQCCHWLATSAAFAAKAAAGHTAHTRGDERPQTTRDTPKRSTKTEYKRNWTQLVHLDLATLNACLWVVSDFEIDICAFVTYLTYSMKRFSTKIEVIKNYSMICMFVFW